MGQVITFYSYKGGVGRSMALANVAVVLSNWGFKTLMIDWDLEAPGIENFFREYVKIAEIKKKKGILEYLTAAQKNGEKIDWQEYVTPIKTPLSKEPIHLMPAGKRDDAGYFKRLREFDISKFYEEHEGGRIIEHLRNELKEKYDFVLLDSRTGVTDVGGICTIQMPDILAVLFTPTEQSLNGIKFIADSARKGQQHFPATRKRLLVFPIPTRIDAGTEFKISQEWIERFAKELAPYYNDWLSANVPRRSFIEQIKLPYISYFSYGEKLPVIEQGTDDPGGLGFAFENVAALLARGLEDSLRFIEDRDGYVRRAQAKKNDGIRISVSLPELPKPLKTFIIYAREDAAFKNELLRQLAPFAQMGLLEKWDDSHILPGEEWEKSIMKALEASQIVLMLVSADSLFSDFIQRKELKKALEQKREGSTRVIPILVRDCLYDMAEGISDLQMLPLHPVSRSLAAVDDLATWGSRASAWAAALRQLREVIADLKEQIKVEEKSATHHISDKNVD